MDYISRIDQPTWYSDDAQRLLTLSGNTAQPTSMSWNAKHLRQLATACMEAADELERRAAAAANQEYAETAS